MSRSATRISELARYRIRKGWTLRDLANMTGLSPAQLCRIERGSATVTPRTMVLLVDTLGLSSDQVKQMLNVQEC